MLVGKMNDHITFYEIDEKIGSVRANGRDKITV